MSLWMITDSQQVGGAISKALRLAFFRSTCLSCPSSLIILKISVYFSKESLGTVQEAPVALFLATITKLAEQASLSSLSNFWRTSICTSMELFPTQETYPERMQSISIEMGQQNSIQSMAAVTIIKSRSFISRSLSLSGVQYLYATFAAIQSIISKSLPTLMVELENCVIFLRRLGLFLKGRLI